jgi:hypothetical protein
MSSKLNSFKKSLSKTQIIFIFCLILITSVIFLNAFLDIYFGRIPFWYDPARDMLLALENLKNPTLIGQPTGIPGIFYGPYWVWLISFFEIFNKDPRFIAFFVLLVPYFTIFLFFSMKFKKVIGLEGSIIFWLLFILSFKNYFTSLWNPHLTPLFFFVFLYLITVLDLGSIKFRSLLIGLGAGISLGIAANFSMSFGIGIMLGTIVYLVIQIAAVSFGKNKKTSLKNYFINSFIIFFGIALSFAPFFLFEVRHGFGQINSYIEASTSKVVGLSGMTDREILTIFFNLPSKIFIIPSIFVYIGIMGMLILEKIRGAKFNKLSDGEMKLAILLIVILISVMSVYLISKNPVWDYHFIGFEIILLMLFVLIVNRYQLFKYITVAVITLLFIINIQNSKFIDSTLIEDSLKAKETVVDLVLSDVGDNNFSVAAYSPSIYTFDYDYLFMNDAKEKLNNPGTQNPEIIYLIFGKKYQYDIKGFIQSRAPDIIYETTKEIKAPDGTVIVRRDYVGEAKE